MEVKIKEKNSPIIIPEKKPKKYIPGQAVLKDKYKNVFKR